MTFCWRFCMPVLMRRRVRLWWVYRMRLSDVIICRTHNTLAQSNSGVVFNLKFAPQWQTCGSLDEWTTRKEYVRRGEGRDMVTGTDALPKQQSDDGLRQYSPDGVFSFPQIFPSNSTYDWCTANEIWKWCASKRRSTINTTIVSQCRRLIAAKQIIAMGD